MSNIDDLEKLQKLKEQGVLTDAEFETEKKKILNNDSDGKTNINLKINKLKDNMKASKNSKIIKCKKCGNEIKEGEKFCGKCGTKIRNNKVKYIIGIIVICMICVGIIIYCNKDVSNNTTTPSTTLSTSESNTSNNTSKENNKIMINASTEYSDTLTGMCFKFSRQDLKNRFCSNYDYDMQTTLGLMDTSFNYIGPDIESNTSLYGLSMYYFYNNYNKKPYFILTTVEDGDGEIIRIMGVIVDYNKLNETQKQNSIDNCKNVITSIDSSISDEEAMAIIKDIFSKTSNNELPFIYKNGLLYQLEDYDQNGYNYIRLSVTAVTKEKAKEIYNIDINSL